MLLCWSVRREIISVGQSCFVLSLLIDLIRVLLHQSLTDQINAFVSHWDLGLIRLLLIFLAPRRIFLFFPFVNHTLRRIRKTFIRLRRVWWRYAEVQCSYRIRVDAIVRWNNSEEFNRIRIFARGSFFLLTFIVPRAESSRSCIEIIEFCYCWRRWSY